MSKRMSSTAFSYIQTQHPDEMTLLEFEVSDFKIFRHRRKKRKTKNKKTDRQKYGEQLSSILEWLNENCSEPYYPRLSNKQILSWSTKIEFYFVEESDAMAFKLMFT